MSQVIMTVGAPGSGKTTYARSLNPTEWIIVCLDDIRASLFGCKKVYFKHLDENQWMRDMVHRVNLGMIRTALGAGKNIVLPNTHTNPESFKDVLKLLDEHGIVPKVVVFDVPWETLVERENKRIPVEAVGLTFLKSSYDQLWAPDAWWRTQKSVEIFKQ